MVVSLHCLHSSMVCYNLHNVITFKFTCHIPRLLITTSSLYDIHQIFDRHLSPQLSRFLITKNSVKLILSNSCDSLISSGFSFLVEIEISYFLLQSRIWRLVIDVYVFCSLHIGSPLNQLFVSCILIDNLHFFFPYRHEQEI